MSKSLAYSEAQIATRPSNGIRFYMIFLAMIGMLAFIIAKNVSLPRTVTISIAAIGLFVFIYASFAKPYFALLLLAVYAPFSRVVTGQFGTQVVGLNLTNIMIILILIGWAFYSSTNGLKFFAKASLNPAILAFCLWGFFSLLRAKLIYGEAYDMDSFFVLFKRWATPIFLYFVGLSIVRDRKSFKKVLFVVMVVTFMIALMAIRDYMNASTSSIESSRVGGVFDQPNTLGAYFVYNMFFFLSFFLCYWKSLKYWLLLIPFMACFRGIMVTFSRGAYLAFGFGSLVVTFFKNKFLFLAAIILLAVVLLNPEFLPEGIQYRLAQTFSGGRVISTNVEDITDSSVGKRMLIWQGALQMIKDEPLFGFGYGTFPYVISSYAPQVKEMDAHNTYLILAAEMGIPALIIFLVILLLLIKNSWWLLKHTEDKYFKAFAIGMLGGIFGLLVANMFGSRLNSEEVSSYFWLLGGLLMRAVIMRKNNEIA